MVTQTFLQRVQLSSQLQRNYFSLVSISFFLLFDLVYGPSTYLVRVVIRMYVHR